MPESANRWTKVEIEQLETDAEGGREDILRSATYLHLILTGRLRIASEYGDTTASAGELIWVPTGTRIDFTFPRRSTYWTLRLRSGAWAGFAEGDREAVGLMRRIDTCARVNGLRLPVSHETGKQVRAVLRELERAARQPEAAWHRPALKGGALRLLSMLAADPQFNREVSGPGLSDDASKRIAPALEMLNRRNFITESSCSVAALAALCGYRPSRFHARFLEVTGTTPVRYLTERRVALACELLGQPHESILDVAFAAGFATQSRFYAAFKQVTGRSPGQWRRLNARG